MIGYKYISEFGIDWRFHHNTLIPLTPPHITPTCTLEQAQSFVKQNKVFLARWDSGFDQAASGEWWHVIKDDKPDISALKSGTRSEIRRCLKQVHIERCDDSFILSHGYPVYAETFKRYQTFESMYSEAEFKQSISNMHSSTEFWGVWSNEGARLIAFAENFPANNACFYASMWFSPEALRLRSSYGLLHTMNAHYLNERSFLYVSDGARSISHNTGIQDFLENKFGFRRAYSTLNVVYTPVVAMIVKCIYPSSSLFNNRLARGNSKIGVLLEQERLRRSCLCSQLKNQHE